MWVRPLGREDPLEKGMANHSSTEATERRACASGQQGNPINEAVSGLFARISTSST